MKERLFSGLVFGAFCLLLLHMGGKAPKTALSPPNREPAGFLSKVLGLKPEFLKTDFARALQGVNLLAGLPHTVQVSAGDDTRALDLEYTVDEKLQAEMEKLLRQYGPDYGAFVAIDPSTGKILAMASTTRNPAYKEPVYLRASYPAASVFKMVTAAAAISRKNFTPDRMMSLNGGKHTLIRRNVFQQHATKWTRYITLREAFAQSVNSVFGRMGAFDLGAGELQDFATRFGFNRDLPIDLPLEKSTSEIGGDSWALAEVASGYTQSTRISPIHGAIMAAAIANDGILMEPYIVERAKTTAGEEAYRANIKMMNLVVDPVTAAQMRKLMRETVLSGTSKKSFKGFFRGAGSFLDVGGKTGTLSGFDPPGKYDWFVGYGEANGQRIAVAALTINERYHRVKSSYLARRAFEAYFQAPLPVAGVPKSFRNMP